MKRGKPKTKKGLSWQKGPPQEPGFFWVRQAGFSRQGIEVVILAEKANGGLIYWSPYAACSISPVLADTMYLKHYGPIVVPKG